MKSNLSILIDRKRALYHYYKKRPDLLSKCKSEVIKKELEDLKSKSAIRSYNEKVRRFLDQYPEYNDHFMRQQ